MLPDVGATALWINACIVIRLMKIPKCRTCGGAHYTFQCFQTPRKPIGTRSTPKTHKPLPSYTKPLQKPRKRLRMQSSNQRPMAIKELDRIFSIYIRLKDSKDGYAVCVTCGARDLWKLMQNGHFIGRTKFGTRWEEKNCHVQCQYCNENLGGNLKVYKQFMIHTYGENIIEELAKQARTAPKLSLSEILTLTGIYKERVKKLLT